MSASSTSSPTRPGLTAAESRELDHLSVKWATQRANAREIERCMQLERKVRAAGQSKVTP